MWFPVPCQAPFLAWEQDGTFSTASDSRLPLQGLHMACSTQGSRREFKRQSFPSPDQLGLSSLPSLPSFLPSSFTVLWIPLCAKMLSVLCSCHRWVGGPMGAAS